MPSSPGWCWLSQTTVLPCFRLCLTSLRQSRRNGCSAQVGPGLVQWSRTLEQLVACACAPSLVAQRLSLYHLVSKIPELVPELAALRVACKDPAGIAINDVVALVRAKGEAFNSEMQTQQAVANMCFAGVADETTVVDESQIPCRFWKVGRCRYGARCKWLHEGPAGVASVAKQHPRGAKKTNKKSSSKKLSQAPGTSQRCLHKSEMFCDFCLD